MSDNTIGFGDGSVNNSLGWGQAPINNTIGFGSVDSWSPNTDLDGGTELANVSAPVISGTAQEGQTVTCSTGTWSGTTPITYAYKWKRNGSNIAGATSSSYTLVTADVGQSIKCEVTATNAVSTLSRDSNTITPISSITDADAQAFITAAAITNPTQQSAINTLVTDLKGYGIWAKMKAIYPMVGGSASSHKFNLKNARDTDGAFRLVFNGGWTHSANGAQPNGTNAFAHTYLIPSAQLSVNSTSISYYSRTSGATGFSYGVNDSGFTNRTLLQLAGSTNYVSIYTAAAGYFTYSGANSLSLLTANRTSKNVSNFFAANVKKATSTNDSTGLPIRAIYFASNNNNGTADNYCNAQCAFASIGDGLTDTEAANFYTAIQAFQTTLGRNI
jgi:hypothetical protein